MLASLCRPYSRITNGLGVDRDLLYFIAYCGGLQALTRPGGSKRPNDQAHLASQSLPVVVGDRIRSQSKCGSSVADFPSYPRPTRVHAEAGDWCKLRNVANEPMYFFCSLSSLECTDASAHATR